MREIICRLLEEIGFYIEESIKEGIPEEKKELIKEIPIPNEEEEEFDDDICFAIDQEKANYYMLDFNEYTPLGIEENILCKQKKYYEYIKRKDDSNLLIKNSSLIIFIEVQNKQEEEALKKLALKLEDDKYYFKKYVLVYIREELDALAKNMGQTQVAEYLHEKIMDKNEFQKFKISQKNNEYRLLLKLLIKIPALNLLNEKKIEFKNLSTIIQDELSINKLNEFTSSILDIDINNVEMAIEKYIEDIGVN